MRRIAGPLPAWFTALVGFAALAAPGAFAQTPTEDVESVVYEPFPEVETAAYQDDSPLDGESIDGESIEGQTFNGETLDGDILPDPESGAGNAVEVIEPGMINGVEIFDPGAEYLDEGTYGEMATVLSSADDFGVCNWYVRADLVLWVRSTPKDRLLAVDTSDVDDALELIQLPNPLSAQATSFRIEPGARLTLVRNLGRDFQNRDHNVEFVYLGGFDYSDSVGVSSRDPRMLDTPQAPENVGGFNRSDRQEFTLTSDFDSAQISVRLQRRPSSDKMVLSPDGRWTRQMQPTFLSSIMGGMRWVRTSEEFRWDSRRNGVSEADFRGDYDINTENNLFGLHIGTDTAWQTSSFRFEMRTQFGALVNFAEQANTVVIVDSDPATTVTGTFVRGEEDEALAFIAEMGWSATYHITECFSFRTSYDFMWIQGIAEAPRQIDFDFPAPSEINVGANAFYQGLSAGFEFFW